MIRAGRAEALWYDDLAILGLKALKGCAVSITEGQRLSTEIAAEMAALNSTNRQLWDLIDWVHSANRPKDDPCRDTEVDQLNHKRNLDKRALQERWFPASAFTETKIGYQ